MHTSSRPFIYLPVPLDGTQSFSSVLPLTPITLSPYSSHSSYVTLPPESHFRVFDVSGNSININITNDSNNGNNSDNPYFSGVIRLVCERCTEQLAEIKNPNSKERNMELHVNKNTTKAEKMDERKRDERRQKNISSNNNKFVSPPPRGVSSLPPVLSSDSSTYPPTVDHSSSLSSTPSVIHVPPSISPDPLSSSRIELLRSILSQLTLDEKYQTVNQLVNEISRKDQSSSSHDSLSSSCSPSTAGNDTKGSKPWGQ